MISDTSLVEVDAANEIWSLYFRVPRLASNALQRQTVYQVEVGVREPHEVEEFNVYNSFGWKLDRKGQGPEHVVRDDIPVYKRIGHVEGDRIIVKYGHGAPMAVSDHITCAVVLHGLDVENIPGERVIKKLK